MAFSLDPPVSREERGVVSPAVVLDAALTLFAERGYHGTSVKEIASRLQIRTPSLYNHMSGKQGLLQEIVGDTTREVWQDFVEVTAGIDGIEARLQEAVYVYALRHARRRREAIIVNRDVSSLEEPVLSEILELRRRHEHAIRGLVQEGIDLGVFADQPASLVSFAVLEMCVSIARWFHVDDQFSAEEVAKQYSLYALRIAKGDTPVKA